ncbi:hypothetical protein DHD80_15650 [Gramella sp. AN32]|nr:hypothetical protein [Gramella sp. AN32]
MGLIIGLLVFNVIAFVFLINSLEERNRIKQKKFIAQRSVLTFNFLSGLKLLLILILGIAIQSFSLLK